MNRTRIPTESSKLIKTLYDKTTEELGKKARDITEMQTPGDQGNATYGLANYIVLQGKKTDNPYYEQAAFFKKQYESNTCYLCGFPIEKGMKEELEHVLPIAEALALTGIIQKSKKDFVPTMPSIYNTPEALSYLLEYARSHRCCNQVKAVTSFLGFSEKPSTKDKKEGSQIEYPYNVDGIALSSCLKSIWTEAHGGTRWQEEGACANKSFTKYFSGMTTEEFIRGRKAFITEKYLNPILNFVYQTVEKAGKFELAELIFLSNQAMSVNPTIWELMGTKWSGSTITKNEAEKKLFTYSKSLNYDNTRDKVLEQLLKMKNKYPALNDKFMKYYTSMKDKTSSRTSMRKVDDSSFKRFINVEFLEMKKIHLELLKTRKYIENDEVRESIKNEGYFGYEYVSNLISSQDSKIILYNSMISKFEKMLENINNYTNLYIYLYILFFDPFKNPKNPQFPNETELEELNDFTSMYVQVIGYGSIHEDFITNIFENFNYVVKRYNTNHVSKDDEYTYLKIQQLNHFTNYVVMSPLLTDVASILIDFSNEYNAAAAIIELGPKYNDYKMEQEAMDVLANLNKKRIEDKEVEGVVNATKKMVSSSSSATTKSSSSSSTKSSATKKSSSSSSAISSITVSPATTSASESDIESTKSSPFSIQSSKRISSSSSSKKRSSSKSPYLHRSERILGRKASSKIPSVSDSVIGRKRSRRSVNEFSKTRKIRRE
jgi:hypothetical protein